MAEQRLWAPWRLEYIEGPKPDECIFCSKPAAGDDAAAHIVARGRAAYVMLNNYPYSSGHLMVAPYEHLASLVDLAPDVASEVMELTQRSLRALTETYGPDGFNLGVNLGEVAGAGVADHVHVHVVPRWGGDTNFMPVIGSTRVLAEALDHSYERLSRIFG